MRYEPAFEVEVRAVLRVAGRARKPPDGPRSAWVAEVDREFVGDAEKEVEDLRVRIERAVRAELDR